YPLFFPSQSFWGWLSICASGYSTCGITILFHAPYQKLILKAVKTVVSELAELHESLISQH
ncbi:MAG: hypothetical protein ACYTXC_29405, partial [Nostoc sp.]